MKKKLMSLVMAAALAVTALAGCGGSGSGASTAAGGDAAASTAGEAAAPAADGKIKIGVSIWSSTDVLGSQCKLILDAAAKALDVDIQYVDQAHVSEQVTASVETLAAAGCKGIIICNSSDTEMASAIKTCNDTEVRYQLMHVAEDMLMATGCLCPLYYYTDLFMISKDVHGFFSNPLGYKYFMYTTIG